MTDGADLDRRWWLALKLLNEVERAGFISGWEEVDDKDTCRPEERYWGTVFVNGEAAETRMGSDKVTVRENLALAAVEIAIFGFAQDREKEANHADTDA